MQIIRRTFKIPGPVIAWARTAEAETVEISEPTGCDLFGGEVAAAAGDLFIECDGQLGYLLRNGAAPATDARGRQPENVGGGWYVAWRND